MATEDTNKRLADVAEWLSELRSRCAASVLPADLSVTAKVPFKLRVYREVLLHRLADLAEAARDQFEQGRPVPGSVLARAAFETMAVLYYFHKMVTRAVGEKDAVALDQMAMRGMFGAKDKSTGYEALNVLTVVGHLDKEFKGLAGMFEFLCEYAHPNMAGTLTSYEQPLRAEQMGDPTVPVLLGRENNHIAMGHGLICLGMAIRVGGTYHRRLAELDPPVVSICEAAISGAGE